MKEELKGRQKVVVDFEDPLRSESQGESPLPLQVKS